MKRIVSCVALSLLSVVIACGGEDGGIQKPDFGNPKDAFEIAVDGLLDDGIGVGDLADAGADTVDGTVPDPVGEAVPPDIPGSDEFVTDQGTDVPKDLGPGCPGGPGCACLDEGDCDEGECVETLDGHECATPCGSKDECPTGWSCEGEKCVAPIQLCRPCVSDVDCDYGPGDGPKLCIEHGPDGRFCGNPCSDVDPCPDGFECADVQVDRGTVKQCMPPEGESCPCWEKFQEDQFVTVCFTENEFGKCEAQTTCYEECPADTPAQESCNGEDDDCDGDTDEDLGTTTCGEGECEVTVPNCFNGNPQECVPPDPSSEEVCNGADDNCDGITDPPGTEGCIVFFRDDDQDGYGVNGDSQCLCTKASPYTAESSGDCNDENGDVNPGKDEECNGIDDDCDDGTDEGFPVGWKCDGDDSDLCESGTWSCKADGSGVECVNEPPFGLEEECNYLDDDCDGDTDEEDAIGCDDYHEDVDGDGYGNPFITKCLCDPIGDFDVDNGDDCDDSNGGANPGEEEDCDTGFDDDCNGDSDEEDALNCTEYFHDEDMDGYGTQDAKCMCGPVGLYSALEGGDCNDGDPDINPGASDCGTDADCDGELLDVGEECDDGNLTQWDGCFGCQVTETMVNTFYTGAQFHPSVSSASDGRFVVTWEGVGDGDPDIGIFGQSFSADGARNGEEFQVNTFTTLAQHYPSVAIHDDASFEVAWEYWQMEFGGNKVFGRRFDTEAVAIGDEYGIGFGDSQNAEMAALEAGKYVAVWEGAGIGARMYNADGSTYGGYISIGDGYIDSQWHPSVSSTGSGRFVVVWQRLHGDGDSWAVTGQRYKADGSKDGGEFQANTWTTDAQERPAVAGSSDGKFTVVWTSYDQDGSAWGVYGQQFDENGTPLGTEFQANTWVNKNQWVPRVARFEDGAFVVVWTSFGQDGSLWGVYGQRYDSGGTPVGDEFQSNIFWTDFQDYPDVAVLPDGGFVVVWGSRGQDGDDWGVFMQRYSSDGSKIWP